MFAWLLGSGNPTPPLPAINEALPPIQPRRWPDDPSEIVTERSSSKGSRICVGVAAAQGGYRMAMEDAHAVHLDAKIAKCLSSEAHLISTYFLWPMVTEALKQQNMRLSVSSLFSVLTSG